MLTVQLLHSELNGRRRDIPGQEAIAAGISACQQLTQTMSPCSRFCSLEDPGIVTLLLLPPMHTTDTSAGTFSVNGGIMKHPLAA